jgi:hypothetical protein
VSYQQRPVDHSARAAIARRLRRQAVACGRLGSSLYADILFSAAVNVEQGGIAWALLAGHEADTPGSALALRLLGAVHRIALEGRASALAAHYPSTGGFPTPDEFLATLENHRDEVCSRLAEPVQTNEIGRAAALVGGFSLIAEKTQLPLRLLEIGASAGLNLLFDRYSYKSSTGTFGDTSSPVEFDLRDSDRSPPNAASMQVVERRGCDSNPLNTHCADDRLTLKSFVWPDQHKRLQLLDAGLEIAQTTPLVVERADAAGWLSETLARPVAGVTTVVFHSIVWQYLEASERNRIRSLLYEAGRGATADTPVAHLSMEPAGPRAELRLRLWPGTCQHLIATAGYHGLPVSWLV